MSTEAAFIPVLCALLGGQPEQRYDYLFGSDLENQSFIRIDCETDSHVIEVGLDKRSSLDSIQQAAFAAYLTDKQPVVAIIDTDGVAGRWEARIEAASSMLGDTVEVIVYSGAGLRQGVLAAPAWRD